MQVDRFQVAEISLSWTNSPGKATCNLPTCYLPTCNLKVLRHNLYRAAVGLLALLAALLTARAALTQLHALADPVSVVVARTAIPPYTPITVGMVELAHLPRASIAGPAYADPGEVVGRLSRLELLPGSPLLRAYVAPAAELRYTTDAQAVVLGVTVEVTRVPADLLRPGQRVDVWQADRLVGPGLRVVAIAGQADGRLVVAVEAGQALVPTLLAASGQPDTALTLAPLERLATPTVTPTVPESVPPETTPKSAPKSATESATTSGAVVTQMPTVPGGVPGSVLPESTPKSTPESAPKSTPVSGVVVVKPGPALGLNVRAGPGTNYPVLAVLPAGTRLTPVARDAEGRWVQVCCVAESQYGWVLVELVELTVELEALPVREVE